MLHPLNSRTLASILFQILLLFPAISHAGDKHNSQILLSTYLIELSELFATPILFKDNDIEKVKVSKIPPGKSVEETLKRLLNNSSLTFKVTANGVLINKNKTLSKTYDSEIIVRGFRETLLKARDIKFESPLIQDSIVAEDIAKFPEHNLADSLQRIPGVTITREAGEGRRIALRGLSPNFTQVQLNGMNVLSNGDSPMDSRGQKPRDRAFDFNIFASELFSQVSVKKAYTANQSEGGIAGTVELTTPKPFDQEGFHSAITAQLGNNQYTDDTAPRAAGLLSNTWGNWGALASFSISQRETEEQGANTTRWRNEGPNGADISHLNTTLQNQWNNKNILVPRGNRYSVWQSDQKRKGFTGALQYQSNTLELSLNSVASHFSAERYEYHLYPRGVNSTPVLNSEHTNNIITQVNAAAINSNNELIFADYANAQMATESRLQKLNTEFQQHTFLTDIFLTADTILSLQTGWAKSKFNMPRSDKIYTEGISDVSIDYRQDRFYGDYQYAQDTTNPDNWWLHEMDLEEYYAETTYQVSSAKLNMIVSETFTLNTGVSRKELNNATARATVNNLFAQAWENDRNQTRPPNAQTLDSNIPDESYSTLKDHEKTEWIALDVDRIIHHFRLDRQQTIKTLGKGTLGINNARDKIKETSYSFFIEAHANTDLKSKPLEFILGVRKFNTDTKSQQFTNQTIQHEYSGILPSFNLRYDLTQDFLFKANISKNITRPDLTALSNIVSIRSGNDTLRVEGVNPKLTPYRSNNFEFSLEWYPGNSHYTALSFFQKDIHDFIVTQTRVLPFSQTGLSNTLVDNPSELVEYTTKQNAENVKIKGFEWSFQTEFDFISSLSFLNALPISFKDFGITGHYTYADGEVSYYNDGNGEYLFNKPLPFLSKHSFSATLFYENTRWGGRLSSHYRSPFISRIDTNVLTEEDERGFHSSQYWDASFHYSFTPQFKIIFEALNLTNEREEQYSDSSDRPYNTTVSGRNFSIGLNISY